MDGRKSEKKRRGVPEVKGGKKDHFCGELSGTIPCGCSRGKSVGSRRKAGSLIDITKHTISCMENVD